MTTIDELKTQFEADAVSIRSLDELENLRVKYLGRKGLISTQFDLIREIAPQERGKFGKSLNEFKIFATGEFERIKNGLTKATSQASDIDLTMPGRNYLTGGLHPLTMIQDEIIHVFRGMGFTVETGPEIESVYYNFDALNTPEHHPVRDETDTFYIESTGKSLVLRTETSPVQIRVMENKKPPIRIIAPGRTYRNDKPDATHSPIFMQCEGLYVDEGVTFADLKGTVLAFYRAIFGDVETRFRPHFFPFTEPSAEVDMTCIFCSGNGCRICKKSGWLEMGGSGMVDPKVLEGVGIDPERYSGWAFGLGIERIAMLKYGVEDIRLFYENDLRFLEQFK